jgi:hypothetical protein
MRRTITVVALAGALAVVALAPMAPAQATTGLGYQFVVGVQLTNTGITLHGHTSVPRGGAVEFLVTNSSKQPRWFFLGGRKTPLLQPKKHSIFFLGFDRRGSYHYRSAGPHARSFSGTFKVT